MHLAVTIVLFIKYINQRRFTIHRIYAVALSYGLSRGQFFVVTGSEIEKGSGKSPNFSIYFLRSESLKLVYR